MTPQHMRGVVGLRSLSVRRGSAAAWIASAAAAWIVGGAVAASAQTMNLVPVGSIPNPQVGSANQFDTIEVRGTHAYVASGKTLTIFNVSNPASPTREGAFTFPEEIWSFTVSGSLAYVGDNFFGLAVLDVSNASAPVLRGSLKTPGQAKAAAVFGTRALVVDHMAGLVLVDISNPAKPISLGSFFVDGYARDVVTSGSLAYAVDSPSGFYVLDLSKPDPLEPVSLLQSGAGLRGVEVSDASAPGPKIAVLLGGGSLQVYDVSNPAKPIQSPPFRTPGGALRVSLKGKLAYVADGAAGLQVVDLSTPFKPAIIGSYKTTGPARDVAVTDSLVFVVTTTEVVILRQSP
jgi:hypothetical protein